MTVDGRSDQARTDLVTPWAATCILARSDGTSLPAAVQRGVAAGRCGVWWIFVDLRC
ncbi:hypothetical protein [Pseudofrankia sp. BMG5.36]|uniref:hypothetical protein n=1 Tax=Pseudofrankia sp. BMG5.36 TaxID=1834512 RepID=UPI0012FF7DC7|nr:hypothetical protein [Pseudofrankia sp. BMG5.36]